MKKFVVTVLLLLIVFCTNAVATDLKIVVNDNFDSLKEGETPQNDWVYDSYNKELGIYAEVVTDPKNDKNKVLKYVKGSGDLVWARKNFNPSGGKVYIDYRFMLDDAFNSVLYVGLVEGVYGLMTYQGAYVYGSTTIPNISPTPLVWHDLHIEIDFLEKRYSSSIDGDVTMDNVFLGDMDLESISQISFGYAEKWVIIDDLKIGYEGGIVKNYTKLKTEKYHYNSSLKGIYNIPLETRPQDFIDNMTFVEGAIYSIYEADGETLYTNRFLEDFCILKVQSPDLKQDWRVEINIQPWKASADTVKTSYKCITLFENSPYIMIKNKKQYIDEDNHYVTPFIKDSEVYVPLRAICDAYNIDISYDFNNKKVSVDGCTINFETINYLGRTFAKVDDVTNVTNTKIIVNENGIITFGDKNLNIDEKQYKTFVSQLEERKGNTVNE